MKGILTTKNITLNFGGVTAIKNLSFALQDNEILSIIGPNGAGKTSIFNTISGLYEPTSGEVFFEKKRLKSYLQFFDYLKMALIAGLSSLIIQTIFNLQSLWSSTITANYFYRQPFDWSKSIHDGINFFLNTDFTPAGVGFGVIFILCYFFRERKTYSTHEIASKGISRTFQNIKLFPELTVSENLMLSKFSESCSSTILNFFKLPKLTKDKNSKLEQVTQTLNKTNISELADRVVSSLSYGDQRRVEIARALVSLPKVILLDEPAAGMNPSESHELMKVISSLKDMGIGIILIEHHMKVVMGISDRIIVLDRGELIADGTPSEIQANSRVIKAYLGDDDHEL